MCMIAAVLCTVTHLSAVLAAGDPPNFRNPAISVAVSGAAAGPQVSARTIATSTATTPGTGTRTYSTAAAAPKAPTPAGAAKGSDVPRINIGVFGCMNAGKR